MIMKPVIIVAATGELNEVAELTLPKMEAAAKRWGADIAIWRDMPERFQHPKYRIFEAGDLKGGLHEDRRILIIDADVIIRENAPNIFDVFKHGTYMLDEAVIHAGITPAFDWQYNLHKDEMAKRAKKHGLEAAIIRHWYNPGVTITDVKTARQIFQMPPWDVAADENLWTVQKGRRIVKNMPWINYRIAQQGIEVHDLPMRWHTMANGINKMEGAYFWHCSGNEFDSDRHQRKAEIILDTCRRYNEPLETRKVLHFVTDLRHKGFGNQAKWILWRLQDEMEKYNKTDYEIDEPSSTPIDKPGYVNFYNPYRHYQGKCRYARDIAFYTHPGNHELWNMARACDSIIVMNEQYRRQLIKIGVPEAKVHRVHLGVDNLFRDCRLRIFHPGRMNASNEYRNRKGYDEWQRLCECDWTDCISSDGEITLEQVRDEYLKADIVLSCATLEGGPMGCLEALAMGKEYMGRAGVGLHDEYRNHIYRYDTYEQMIHMLFELYKSKESMSNAVIANQWALCCGQIWDMITGEARSESAETVKEIKPKRKIPFNICAKSR